MLNREELKEIAGIQAGDQYFVSLYLNVNPLTNPGGEYIIWLKNALRNTSSLDKDVLRRAEKDLGAVEDYVIGSRREMKKGLALISSAGAGFWREYSLSVPLKNELVIDRTPYIQPLLAVLNNYPRYAVLLVEREAARIFVFHLGELAEYVDVRSGDVPGKHKKGGWFALSQNHYARHVNAHVMLYLKDVIERLEPFLSGELIDRLVIGGSDDAMSRVKELLPQPVREKIIGTFRSGMYEDIPAIIKKVEPVCRVFEKRREQETVSGLVGRALKNEKAVIGLDDVLDALREGRVMRLVLLRDFQSSGFQCTSCRALSASDGKCRYCGGDLEEVKYIVDLAAQKAVEQNSPVEVLGENEELRKAGNIGAFLRF